MKILTLKIVYKLGKMNMFFMEAIRGGSNYVKQKDENNFPAVHE